MNLRYYPYNKHYLGKVDLLSSMCLEHPCNWTDSIHITILLHDFKDAVKYYELHLTKLELKIKIAMKYCNYVSGYFATYTRPPTTKVNNKSANEFKFYLIKPLKMQWISTQLPNYFIQKDQKFDGHISKTTSSYSDQQNDTQEDLILMKQLVKNT